MASKRFPVRKQSEQCTDFVNLEAKFSGEMEARVAVDGQAAGEEECQVESSAAAAAAQVGDRKEFSSKKKQQGGFKSMVVKFVRRVVGVKQSSKSRTVEGGDWCAEDGKRPLRSGVYDSDHSLRRSISRKVNDACLEPELVQANPMHDRETEFRRCESVRPFTSACSNASKRTVDDKVWRGQETGSSYRLCKGLGRGGYGTVYEARRESDGELVAIKEPLRRSITAVREVSALKAFRNAGGSPYVVQLWDIIKNNSGGDALSTSIVLELCDTNLLEFREHHNLPEAVRMEMTRQYFSGLGFCHAHGYLHGDLTLVNVLVSIRQGVVKLTDFGLSRKLEHGSLSSTCHGIVPRQDVLCPEQTEGVQIGGAMSESDLRILAKDLESSVKLLVDLWLSFYELSSNAPNGIHAMNEEATEDMQVERKMLLRSACKFVCNTLGKPMSGRIREFREEVVRWCRESSEPVNAKSVLCEFLLWMAKQPQAGYMWHSMEIPEALVENCFLLCYQLDNDVLISAEGISERLDSIVCAETRAASKQFFEDLVKQ